MTGAPNAECACTEDDYKAACRALAFGQDVHAEARKRWNNEGYKALLSAAEFHAQALKLAHSIATERAVHAQFDGSVPS